MAKVLFLGPSDQPRAASRANPASRSAFRSSTSSSPIWRRSAGPSACHSVADAIVFRVERQDQALEAPPGIAHAEQAEPVEHGGEPFVGTGFSTIENKPEAPVKSRFQIVCPGSEGRPGWITRATSGRAASQRAISNADR